MQIRKHFRFEAAHVLPYHLGKCARPHGHSYRLEVALRGPIRTSGPATGMIEDFDTVREIVHRHVVDELDHTSLNDRIANPTCEEILAWIWEKLDRALPGLDELVLWETATSCATLRRSDLAGNT
ncbi:MAG TPA: 6-carboxytetrahydropterin synthase [Candidatus Baltobacteraceae bacterium]|nr:6-carboxytetrahydropterin synthase [Candidatus Baltobacteraceae bacterium]